MAGASCHGTPAETLLDIAVSAPVCLYVKQHLLPRKSGVVSCSRQDMWADLAGGSSRWARSARMLPAALPLIGGPGTSTQRPSACPATREAAAALKKQCIQSSVMLGHGAPVWACIPMLQCLRDMCSV